MKKKFARFTIFAAYSALIGLYFIVNAQDQYLRAYECLAIFILSLTITHWPFIIGVSVPTLYVKSIDYAWLGAGIVSAFSGIISYQLNSVERGYQEERTQATNILNNIEFVTNRVEAQCLPVEMRYPGSNKSILSSDDCDTTHFINGMIDSFRGNKEFPIAKSFSDGGYMFNSFDHFVEYPKYAQKIEILQNKINFPLYQYMRDYEGHTRSALKFDRNDRAILEASPFKLPSWWVFLFSFAGALRIAKTSHEVAPELAKYKDKLAQSQNPRIIAARRVLALFSRSL